MSGYHRGTLGAAVTFLISIATVVTYRATAPCPGRAQWRHMEGSNWPWALVGLVVLTWELLGLDTGKGTHLTLSGLTQAIRPLSAVTMMIWLLVGLRCALERRQPKRASSKPAPTDVLGATTGWSLHLHMASPGLVALALPSSRSVGVCFWIAAGVGSLGLEIWARRSGGRVATANEVLSFGCRSQIGQFLVVAAWVIAGYHLFG